MNSKFLRAFYYFLTTLVFWISATRPAQTQQNALSIFPSQPLIETDSFEQFLNFDLTVTNHSPGALDITGIQVSVYGPKHHLLLRKSLNNNGRSPSIALIGPTTIEAGKTICVFNPFFQFPKGIEIREMEFEFFANKVNKEYHDRPAFKRLPFDYDTLFRITVKPELYQLHALLQLPLKGNLIIWDGHDFFSHHRRFPIGTPATIAAGINANTNRYANDINPVDSSGNMFKGSPFKKENWYAYGQKIFAPGNGVVIAVENNIPDNEFDGDKVVSPKLPEGIDSLGMGNYIIIDHGNHEYSIMLHMKAGSVRVKKGDHVQQGVWIGNIGFSGDAINPHLHYTVTSGINEGRDEGIPTYFKNFYRYHQGKWVLCLYGRVDSGDLVRQGK